MGCDSHPCIEVYSRGAWRLRYCRGAFYRQREKQGLSYEEMDALKSSYYKALDRRNYTLFAILADVRNFDGAIAPLFPGRGLPENAAKRTFKEIPEDGDYHSHTYFTLGELLDTDWDAQAGPAFSVCIYAADYMAWKEAGKVPDYADESPENHDDSTREVTEEEMLMLLLANTPKQLTKFKVTPWVARLRAAAKRKGEPVPPEAPRVRSGPYIRVTAPRTYRQLVPDFVDVIPAMKELGDPENVRVVIAFDN